MKNYETLKSLGVNISEMPLIGRIRLRGYRDQSIGEPPNRRGSVGYRMEGKSEEQEKDDRFERGRKRGYDQERDRIDKEGSVEEKRGEEKGRDDAREGR